MAEVSRQNRRSLRILVSVGWVCTSFGMRNPLYSATGEIDDLTARTPCAWCTHSAFRVTISLSSVRSLRFGRWHDRNEKIRSSPSPSPSRPVPVARSLFVSGFRNFALKILEPDKSRSRYCRRREPTRKKRIKRAFRFSTVFGVTTSVKGYAATNPERATKTSSLFLSQYTKIFVIFYSAIRKRYPLNFIASVWNHNLTSDGSIALNFFL